MCPSAPQSSRVGLVERRVDAPMKIGMVGGFQLKRNGSGGLGGGLHSGGGLTQSENPGCRLDVGNSASLRRLGQFPQFVVAGSQVAAS